MKTEAETHYLADSEELHEAQTEIRHLRNSIEGTARNSGGVQVR